MLFNIDILLFEEHYKSFYRLNGYALGGSSILTLKC